MRQRLILACAVVGLGALALMDLHASGQELYGDEVDADVDDVDYDAITVELRAVRQELWATQGELSRVRGANRSLHDDNRALRGENGRLAQSLDEARRKLATYEARKPRVTVFTTSYCLPCKELLRQLEEAQRRIAFDVLVVYEDDTSPTQVRSIRQQVAAGMPFPYELGRGLQRRKELFNDPAETGYPLCWLQGSDARKTYRVRAEQRPATVDGWVREIENLWKPACQAGF